MYNKSGMKIKGRMLKKGDKVRLTRDGVKTQQWRWRCPAGLICPGAGRITEFVGGKRFGTTERVVVLFPKIGHCRSTSNPHSPDDHRSDNSVRFNVFSDT